MSEKSLPEAANEKSLPETASEKCLFTEEEAAVYLGVSRSYLSKARSRGTLHNGTPAPPHMKLGGTAIRYRRDDLDAWIATQQRWNHRLEPAS